MTELRAIQTVRTSNYSVAILVKGGSCGGMKVKSFKRCSVDGCDRQFLANGVCSMHYQRLLRGGSLDRRMSRYKAGNYVSEGYTMVHLGKNEYKAEHVLMAEKALGKPLPPGAEVHHVDRDKSNNNTKTKWNLVVCPDHSYHALLHRRAVALGYEKRNGRKLTEEQAAEIRQSQLSHRDIAAIYGVSKSCVGAIKSGKIWSVDLCIAAQRGDDAEV